MAPDLKKKCVLVIPDAGPLISLQKAGCLHLLLKLEIPIIVLDAVYYEVVVDPEKYESDKELKEFFDLNVKYYTTYVGDVMLQKRNSGEKCKQMGDAAILEFMQNDVEDLAKDNPLLLLLEDSGLLISFKNRFSNVHFLSTTGFLRGLEREKIIDSADAVLQRIGLNTRLSYTPDYEPHDESRKDNYPKAVGLAEGSSTVFRLKSRKNISMPEAQP